MLDLLQSGVACFQILLLKHHQLHGDLNHYEFPNCAKRKRIRRCKANDLRACFYLLLEIPAALCCQFISFLTCWSLVDRYSLCILLGSTTAQVVRDTKTHDINLDRSRGQQDVRGCHISDDPRTACHFCVIPTGETRASPLGFASPPLQVTVPGRLPA